jgi:hypothetical protein
VLKPGLSTKELGITEILPMSFSSDTNAYTVTGRGIKLIALFPYTFTVSLPNQIK